MTMSPTKFAWRMSSFAPLRLIGNGLLSFSVLFLGLAALASDVFLAHAAASFSLALLTYGLVLWAGRREYRELSDAHRRAKLENWVQESQDAQERARRRELLENNSLSAAWASAGLFDSPSFAPQVNTDGTPMAPGNAGVDIWGHAYGMPAHEAPVFNPDTQTWADPSASYTSPLDSSGSGGLPN